MEYKVSYPTGSFKNFNKIYDTATRDRPRYLGERFRVPSWWKHAEVMSTFDKIMVDKVFLTVQLVIQSADGTAQEAYSHPAAHSVGHL